MWVLCSFIQIVITAPVFICWNTKCSNMSFLKMGQHFEIQITSITKHAGIVQSGHHLNKCKLFPSWYSCTNCSYGVKQQSPNPLINNLALICMVSYLHIALYLSWYALLWYLSKLHKPLVALPEHLSSPFFLCTCCAIFGFLCSIFPLHCLSFNLRFLVTPLVSSNFLDPRNVGLFWQFINDSNYSIMFLFLQMYS